MSKPNNDSRFAVLGAGVTGLCAAFYLTRHFGQGSVRVFEAAPQPGGYARTSHEAGFQLDWGPNGFLNREPLTLEWVDDLGLSSRLVEADQAAARRFIVRDGRLVELVPPPRFLVSPALSAAGRLRLLCEPLIANRRGDAPESVWDFAARRIGREAADWLVSPMVSGIFGGDAKALSLAHCFPRMAAMERDYGSLFKAMKAKKRENPGASAMGPGGVLTTLDEGIGLLGDTAAQALGDSLCCGAPVAKITRDNSGYTLILENGQASRAEAIVVAMPTHRAAPLLAGLDPDCAGALSNVEYCNIAVVCTAYPREQVGHDMKGFGFLVPRKEGRRALGCIWTSSIFPHQAPNGWVLLRTMIGGTTDPGAVDLDDGPLLDCVEREIHSLMGISGPPELVQIYRHRRAIPQYGLDHQSLLDALHAAQSRLPNLVFAGNAYRGVGLNDCVVSAIGATRHLIGELGA